MTSPKVCGVCLATDVKLNCIEGLLELQVISLFGSNSLFSQDIPCYACYECTWLIRKFSKIKEKYLTSQTILFDIIQNNKHVPIVNVEELIIQDLYLESFDDPQMITEENLKQIDRRALCLQTNIALCKLPCLNINGDVKRDETDLLLDMKVEDGVMECCVSAAKVYDDDKPLSQVFIDKCDIKKKKKGKDDRRKHKEKNLLSKLKIVDKGKGISKSVDNEALKDFIISQLTLPEQLAEVEKRKNSPNYKDSPYRCDICYKGFLQVDTLNNHTIRHELISGDIECGVCKFRFVSRRAYALHVARHTRKFSCTRCSFVTVHIDQAKKHKQWHDGVTYKCQYCNEVSNKLTSHLSHIRMKHTSEFVCDVCGYSFVSDKGLKMHKTRMHKQCKDRDGNPKAGVDESSLYCKECDLQFTTREAWKRHQVTSAKHRDKIGTACRACGETFSSAGRLRSHARTHATAATALARALVARRRYIPRDRRPRNLRNTLGLSYPTTCEHCSETIADRSRHWKHYQRCHQDKKYPLSENNYICEYCGKGFQANAFLVYHKRTHFEERTYKCPVCPKSFHTASTLRAHRLTHSVVRPYPCSLCYKTFKTKLGLQQHIKSHSGRRPFSCQYCGKSFSRGSCLTLHVNRLHTRQTETDKDLSN